MPRLSLRQRVACLLSRRASAWRWLPALSPSSPAPPSAWRALRRWPLRGWRAAQSSWACPSSRFELHWSQCSACLRRHRLQLRTESIHQKHRQPEKEEDPEENTGLRLERIGLGRPWSIWRAFAANFFSLERVHNFRFLSEVVLAPGVLLSAANWISHIKGIAKWNEHCACTGWGNFQNVRDAF